jgi:hypothetical protein
MRLFAEEVMPRFKTRDGASRRPVSVPVAAAAGAAVA